LLERKFRSKVRVGDNGLGGGWLVVVADGGWLWLVDGLWPATGVGGGSFLTCGED